MPDLEQGLPRERGRRCRRAGRSRHEIAVIGRPPFLPVPAAALLAVFDPVTGYLYTRRA